MTEELNGGCLDERESFETYIVAEGYDGKHWLQRWPVGDEAQKSRYVKDWVQTAWEAFQAGRASLSTSKQAGAEPVAWRYRLKGFPWQYQDIPFFAGGTPGPREEHQALTLDDLLAILSAEKDAAPGAAVAAREQEVLPEPVMLSLFEGGETTWPHYFDLKVGQRVRVHTGEEGRIETILRGTKKYHVLIRPDYGGTYGAWEVTPLASREEAPATPPAAIPAAPSEVTAWTYRHNVLTGIADWLETRGATSWAEQLGYSGLMRSWSKDLRQIDAALSQPTTVQQAQRVCGNPDCGWKGHTNRMLGSIGPLCPECGETTEENNS